MPQFWQELIKYLGGMAIASAALAWLAKQIIVHFLSKDVEAYKVRLKAESDKEIESLKSQLQLLNQQQLIRYSALHEKRAEAIQRLYSLLDTATVEAHVLKEFYILPQSRNTKIMETTYSEQLANSAKELQRVFMGNQLYFGTEICRILLGTIGQLHICTFIHEDISKMSASAPESKKRIKEWEALEEKIAESKNALADEFRKLIGSEE